MKDSSIDYHQILEVAKISAKKAGNFIKQAHSNKDLRVEFKDRTNLVTQYDLESERIIINSIKEFFPEHCFLTEETNSHHNDSSVYYQPIWVVDPIDGTTNFVHGHYQVAVSIGFAINGELKVGVVYNPFLEEFFYAIKGLGAFKNDNPITCSQTSQLSDALFVTGFPYFKDEIDTIIKRIRAVLTSARELRRLGSGALDICWVADGRMDVYYESLSPWDCAGGIVIAKEAGVICGHIYEVPSEFTLPKDFYTKDMLFANPKLFEQAKKLLQV